ncbi:unnamed protein product [Hermetia illucens]|uniref:Uncharacterized protein n=1 Tax=Hermetia illucens TaxID=343691 RepID=A0A7R8USG7_HERIL|nr:RNA-binding protein 5-B-like isoform X2 [Hermetia illucens]CAD7086141.1 unnamed protein product [Hermetia illucens]
MDRRSRSIESPRRYKNRRDHPRRHSRSRSRSRNRSRDRRRRSRSRSRSRERYNNRRSQERDLYKDIINEDYQEEHDRYNRNDKKSREKGRDGGYGSGYDNYNRRDRDRDRHKRYYSSDRDDRSDSYDSDGYNDHYSNQTPNNIIILRGLAQHITEADISNELAQSGLQPVSIRLIRKRKTGASRGFAFVEFSTEEEATRWMEYKQGNLMLQDHYRAVMQYSHSKEPLAKERILSDWYCAKCGVFNFKRRENCFKCYASREESEKGGEGSDEVSNILTKKIMLRNLDVLTNEEGVLTVMQEVIPSLVSKIAKILICRDPLTSTSRGICYLYFDNLVDSMNTHNSLKALEPPLIIEKREVLVSYCVDSENKQITKPSSQSTKTADPAASYTANTYQYTLADVPRLAEYSASMYASTPAEQEHYVKYYTQYYIAEITKGQYGNLPTMSQLGESANSGAAVALSAIQRKQNKLKGNGADAASTTAATAAAVSATVPTVAAVPVQVPTGTDGKKYPTPDVSLYQYDETSGYYYDPLTSLYYDPHSQYYYNNETGSYLYWSQEHSTYLLASAAATTAAATVTSTDALTATTPAVTATPAILVGQAEPAKLATASEEKKETKKESKQDKVKVAKKIVKDMEKWAKQLNQKKDNFVVATPQPILTTKLDDIVPKPASISSGYADVGFSILEKKEKGKLDIPATPMIMSKLVSSYGSDSDDHEESNHSQGYSAEINEKDYVDFEKLTCLLCKRAFQSQDILQKHLKMSNLHKENLQKYNLTRGILDINSGNSATGYRDRAKERRLKYGESDPPPPNRSKERFEKELKSVTSSAQMNAASVPIGENNVGNRLLQKMGWSEGQGLGKSNQGRTKIIEADARSSTAGLGTKTSAFTPGDDYKSYIKRMMKSRYEQADVKE